MARVRPGRWMFTNSVVPSGENVAPANSEKFIALRPKWYNLPVGVMPTADGYINISAMRDAHYAALCKVLGRPDLAVHPKYDTRDKRRAHKDEVMALLRQEFAKRETAHWQRELTAAGVMTDARAALSG